MKIMPMDFTNLDEQTKSLRLFQMFVIYSKLASGLKNLR
jgi:hypothetical protein